MVDTTFQLDVAPVGSGGSSQIQGVYASETRFAGSVFPSNAIIPREVMPGYQFYEPTTGVSYVGTRQGTWVKLQSPEGLAIVRGESEKFQAWQASLGELKAREAYEREKNAPAPTVVESIVDTKEKFISPSSPVFSYLTPYTQQRIQEGVKYSGVTSMMLAAGPQVVPAGRNVLGELYSATAGGSRLGVSLQESSKLIAPEAFKPLPKLSVSAEEIFPLTEYQQEVRAKMGETAFREIYFSPEALNRYSKQFEGLISSYNQSPSVEGYNKLLRFSSGLESFYQGVEREYARDISNFERNIRFYTVKYGPSIGLTYKAAGEGDIFAKLKLENSFIVQEPSGEFKLVNKKDFVIVEPELSRAASVDQYRLIEQAELEREGLAYEEIDVARQFELEIPPFKPFKPVVEFEKRTELGGKVVKLFFEFDKTLFEPGFSEFEKVFPAISYLKSFRSASLDVIGNIGSGLVTSFNPTPVFKSGVKLASTLTIFSKTYPIAFQRMEEGRAYLFGEKGIVGTALTGGWSGEVVRNPVQTATVVGSLLVGYKISKEFYKPDILPSLSYQSVTIPVEGKPATVFRAVAGKGFGVAAKPEVILGYTETGKFVTRLPKVSEMPSLSKLTPAVHAEGVSETFIPRTGFETRVLTQKPVLQKLFGPDADKVATQLFLRDALESQRSIFTVNQFPKLTKRLTAEQVELTLNYFKRNRSAIERVYGSFPQQSEVNPAYARLAGDIEVQLRTKSFAEAKLFSEELSELYRNAGLKTSVEGVAIKLKGNTVIDVHYMDEPPLPQDALFASPSSAGLEYGRAISPATKTVEGLPTSTLQEQLIRKGSASTKWWRQAELRAYDAMAKEGGVKLPSLAKVKAEKLIVEPPLHRAKDIPDFYFISKSLEESAVATGSKSVSDLLKVDAALKRFRAFEWRTPGVAEKYAEIVAGKELVKTELALPPSSTVSSKALSVAAYRGASTLASSGYGSISFYSSYGYPRLKSVSSVPSITSRPSAPSRPSLTSFPSRFSLPSRVSVPSRPSVPSAPSLPSVPSVPSLTSVPSVPSLPSAPSVPSKPSVPSAPSIPSVPSRPSVPSVPSIPSRPSVPSRPTPPSIPRIVYPPSKPFSLPSSQASKRLLGRSRGFKTLVKRRGKWLQIGGVASRGVALKRGESFALRTLGASFKAVPTGGTVEGEGEAGFAPSKFFRGYRVVRGQRVPLLDEFIQKRGQRLVSRSERSEIQAAKPRSFFGRAKKKFKRWI